MFRETCNSFVCGALTVAVIGCGQSSVSSNRPVADHSTSHSVLKNDVLLSQRPSDALPVAELRESAEDGSTVTLLGRIGGAVNPWVEGRAAFTVVDPKLEPCKPDEGCPTPWDYCCLTDQIPSQRAMIKVIDNNGETLEQDARELLGVKELQTIVVKGKAKRDEAGNLTVLADGVYVVPSNQ